MQQIRDFVYLDWERIRSFVAQADRGVPESRTGSISDEHGSAAEAGVSLFGSLSGAHSDDARYTRSSSETRSLHHAVFADFEKHLEAHELLGDANEWTKKALAGGGFLRVGGLVRLVDYAAVVGLVRGLKGLLGVGLAVQKSAVLGDASLNPQERQKRIREIEKESKTQNRGLNELGVDGMASTIEQLYGDVVRVKIVPDPDFPERVLVGTCDPDAMDSGFRRAIGSRGYSTLWSLQSLVYVEPMASGVSPEVVPTGNQMEDAIDALVGHMDALARVAGGYKFPAISCIPIAIYRVVADS